MDGADIDRVVAHLLGQAAEVHVAAEEEEVEGRLGGQEQVDIRALFQQGLGLGGVVLFDGLDEVAGEGVLCDGMGGPQQHQAGEKTVHAS